MRLGKATGGLVQQHLAKSGADVVAETFRLRININRSLTDGASKAPPSASCNPLAAILQNDTAKKCLKFYFHF